MLRYCWRLSSFPKRLTVDGEQYVFFSHRSWYCVSILFIWIKWFGPVYKAGFTNASECSRLSKDELKRLQIRGATYSTHEDIKRCKKFTIWSEYLTSPFVTNTFPSLSIVGTYRFNLTYYSKESSQLDVNK